MVGLELPNFEEESTILSMKTKSKKKVLIAPVRSIGHLRALARENPQYNQLALIAASNLGGTKENTKDLDSAIRWLECNAMESGDEESGGGEKGVVEEINFCRDLVVA